MSDQPHFAGLPAPLVKKLHAFGQEHVLRFWQELDPGRRSHLTRQLEAIDLELIAKLVSGSEAKPDYAALAARAAAPPAVRRDGTGAAWSPTDAREAGRKAIRQGRVAAVIVAGGQGTRLGFDLPKGLFPIGPLSDRTLFQCFADKLIAMREHYGVAIPLYVMTSPLTHDQTVDYWSENDFLGLPPEDVILFCQGTMPAVDAETGKLLLADKDSLCLSPDGHGGTIKALDSAGCFEDATRRGVELFSYIQVDNPLAALCDPDLIGHHLMAGSEMTTQVVRKRYAEEKVGNVVMIDGSVRIIEYSDLPAAAAERRDQAGELSLWAGNIAVHVFDLAFLRRAVASSDALPFHHALKATPYLNDQGQMVQPEEPNSIKFERFIFDLLPWAENAFVVEADPGKAFAPVKNADGAANDTPELARQAMVQLDRQRLQAAGVKVASDARVEINPRFAFTDEQLAAKMTAGETIAADRYFGP